VILTLLDVLPSLYHLFQYTLSWGGYSDMPLTCRQKKIDVHGYAVINNGRYATKTAQVTTYV
jgi:hypothetical protein